MIRSFWTMHISLVLLISASNSTPRHLKTATCIAFAERKYWLGIGRFDNFSKTLCFLKTCIFWQCFKNVIQVVGFRRWNHYKTSRFSSHAVSPREYWWFWSRKRPLSEKWHFRDVETGSAQRNLIACTEKPNRPLGPFRESCKYHRKTWCFQKCACGCGYFTFSSSQNSGNSLLFELVDLKLDQDFN